MIKSIRIHHTSDGGTLEIGVSAKTFVEVNGVRVALSTLLELAQNAGAMVEIGNRGGTLTFTPHRCPEPEPVAPPKPARKSVKETPET